MEARAHDESLLSLRAAAMSSSLGGESEKVVTKRTIDVSRAALNLRQWLLM
jgi:hypothetical protein